MPYSIKYQIMHEVNHGTEDEPDIKQILNNCEIRCEDEMLEANLALAKKEAYNGEVTTEYISYTEEEARAKRDKLLVESDWTQTLDAPIDAETREAYRVYRQALRDIPEQEDFPNTIVWPELPVVTKAEPDPVDTAVDVLLGGEN